MKFFLTLGVMRCRNIQLNTGLVREKKTEFNETDENECDLVDECEFNFSTRNKSD